MAKPRSVCANRSTPLVKAVFRPIAFTLIVSFSVRSRTKSRAQAKASFVRSCCQWFPVQQNHAAGIVIEQELAAILLGESERGGILGDQCLLPGELGELDDVVDVLMPIFA